MGHGAPDSSWMVDVRERVDARLRAFLEAKQENARRTSPEGVELADSIARLTLRGGKRLRPAVLVASFQTVAPDGDLARTDDASAAIELLQSYLLIHDDWMDLDDERRGGPSTFAELRDRYDDAHLGASLAVLAGDLASAYAWELCVSAPFPEGRLRDGLAAFTRMQEEVFFGQHLDLTGSMDVARMHDLKTGSYTVRGPLRLGALLGGASGEQLAALERFGDPLGLAFQIRDDLLGTFGDPSKTGKPAGNDLRAGKRTSLVRTAEERLSEAERAPLTAVFGMRDADDSAVAEAAELLVSRGIRKEVEDRLEALVAEAHEALRSGPFADLGRERLGALTELLARREK